MPKQNAQATELNRKNSYNFNYKFSMILIIKQTSIDKPYLIGYNINAKGIEI